MLYYLKNINSDTTYYLVNKNEFIVGRKDCDIVIEKDSSISRKHVQLRIKAGKKDEVVTMEDLGSKYKTFYNGEKVTPNIEIQLKNNDKIQFGITTSIFTFHKEKFVTTATKLSSVQKEVLNSQIKLLRGEYLPNWNSNCTHLTLDEITLTVKVLHALLDDKPLVLTSFWTKYAENIAKNLPPPDINDYNNPPAAEALLNQVDLKKPVNRKNLFKNKCFLFFSEKEKIQVEQIIDRAGGSSISWETNPIQLETILQSRKEFLLIQTTCSTDDEAYNRIIKHFSEQNMRTIPNPEIALALMRGSCEKDCNPAFDRTKEVFHSTSVRSTQHKPLVESTQTQASLFSQNKQDTPRIIPATLGDTEMDMYPIKKRKPEKNEEILLDNPFKRKKTQDSSVHNISKATTKRIEVENMADENEFRKMVFKKTGSAQRTASQISQANIFDMSNNKNVVSQLQKRKADVSVDNNFSDFRTGKLDEITKSVDNYFGDFFKKPRIENPSDEKPLNSFNNFLLTQDEEINDSKAFSITKLDEVNDTSYYTKSNCTINKSCNWISKNLSVETSNIKEEEKEIDVDRQHYIDLLKDKLIVEVMSQLVIRSRYSANEVDGNVTLDKVNCKKFRKVNPLHPQIKIISKESFIVQESGDVTGINDTRRVEHNSDNETSNHKENKRRLNKFQS